MTDDLNHPETSTAQRVVIMGCVAMATMLNYGSHMKECLDQARWAEFSLALLACAAGLAIFERGIAALQVSVALNDPKGLDLKARARQSKKAFKRAMGWMIISSVIMASPELLRPVLIS